MGGRIYDYNLGRFLNVDPIIGNPLSSQSLNPYSYIGNNPLSGTDPTGYAAQDHCMGDQFCQALSDQEFLGGEVGKLRSSLTSGGVPAGRGHADNGNDSTLDIYGKKKSQKAQGTVTVGALENCRATDCGSTMLTMSADQRLYQMPHSSLDPRDDPMFQLIGHDIAAVVAYATAKFTGNDLLANIVADDMAQKTSANWSLAAGLYLMGRGGKGAPEPGVIETPRGPAIQEMTPEALTALQQVTNGGMVFRAGEFGYQRLPDGQFWSFQNPASASGYAGKMGMPGSTNPQFDWIMGGRLSPGSPVITRGAPGINLNKGGSMEAVVPPGGVRAEWFHMLDKKP